MQVRSVVRYIPNSDHDDPGALATDAVSSSTFRSSNKVQNSRSREIDAQQADADRRRVVWDAEDPLLTDADGEGEDDPDFVNDSGVAFVEPLGVKTDDGTIRPMTAQDFDSAANAMDVDEHERIFGKPDYEPERLGQLVRISKSNLTCTNVLFQKNQRLQTTRSTLEPTQLVDAHLQTQELEGASQCETEAAQTQIMELFGKSLHLRSMSRL